MEHDSSSPRFDAFQLINVRRFSSRHELPTLYQPLLSDKYFDGGTVLFSSFSEIDEEIL